MKATRLARTNHLEADFRTGSGPTLRYAPPKSVQEGRRARGDGPFWGAARRSGGPTASRSPVEFEAARTGQAARAPLR